MSDFGVGVNATVPGVERYEQGREPLLTLAAGCVDNVIGQLQRANDSSLSDGYADTILDEAKARAENILKQLLDSFCRERRLLNLMLDLQVADQHTALMIAVKKDIEPGVKMLLESEADQSLANKEGKMTKQNAEERGNQKIIALFGKKGKTERQIAEELRLVEQERMARFGTCTPQ